MVTKTIKRTVGGQTRTAEVPAERDAEYGLTVSLADLAYAEAKMFPTAYNFALRLTHAAKKPATQWRRLTLGAAHE